MQAKMCAYGFLVKRHKLTLFNAYFMLLLVYESTTKALSNRRGGEVGLKVGSYPHTAEIYWSILIFELN